MKKKQQKKVPAHSPARAAVLFAALTATFFAYVSQVRALEQGAVSFQANMLERATATENGLSGIGFVAVDEISTASRRPAAMSEAAKSRALQIIRRRQRQQMHSAAERKEETKPPCADQE